MKTVYRPVLTICVLTTLGAPVYAVDLRNEDGSSYDVKINSGAMSTSTSIGGSTTQSNVCSSCEIEVAGVGKIEASGSETVVIKDGKISKR